MLSFHTIVGLFLFGCYCFPSVKRGCHACNPLKNLNIICSADYADMISESQSSKHWEIQNSD